MKTEMVKAYIQNTNDYEYLFDGSTSPTWEEPVILNDIVHVEVKIKSLHKDKIRIDLIDLLAFVFENNYK